MGLIEVEYGREISVNLVISESSVRKRLLPDIVMNNEGHNLRRGGMFKNGMCREIEQQKRSLRLCKIGCIAVWRELA